MVGMQRKERKVRGIGNVSLYWEAQVRRKLQTLTKKYVLEYIHSLEKLSDVWKYLCDYTNRHKLYFAFA